ncbi:MAG: F0F1 ATP synthase subunit delta [Gallionella sp.]|nr:F0F1 ATP synthase subunit delta [Gallionella sp.]
MLIDWFTVVAQIANFLILVWLLKRFLYQPILQAIDAREKRIATQIAEAQQTATAAAQQQAEFQRKNAEFDQQRAALFAEANATAQAERQTLLTTARTEADALREKFQQSLQNEQRVLQQAILQRTQQQIFDLTRKTLTDLADTSLEQQMIKVFIRRLGELSDDERAQLQIGSPSVRSAFALTSAQQTDITAALQNLAVGANLFARPSFITDPNCISGIELNVDGHKLAWSVASYLNDLEQSVAGELK